MYEFLVIQCVPAVVGMMVHCFHFIAVKPMIEALVIGMLKVPAIRMPECVEAVQETPWQVVVSDVFVPAASVGRAVGFA